ncbi:MULTISPECIES: contact-dependent growth inhibition system immunity protein [unclassified Streptomyces]|uniref:contact-dependent growth inhibition system immunity protein n=1 Tax=unclassified Streptomyces TaxID=2593676 RepID=UPI002E2E34DB|nr:MULTISPECIES: contact-dependent growth inhibition system immunity protein [unclassified Streptomyces]
MARLLHLDRTLDELDTPAWPPTPPDASRLVAKVHALRRKRLDELTPADLNTLVGQDVALPYVLPLAVALLLREPLLDAYYYPGDLLLNVVTRPQAAWTPLPDQAGALAAVLPCLPTEELPRGAAVGLARFVADFG